MEGQYRFNSNLLILLICINCLSNVESLPINTINYSWLETGGECAAACNGGVKVLCQSVNPPKASLASSMSASSWSFFWRSFSATSSSGLSTVDSWFSFNCKTHTHTTEWLRHKPLPKKNVYWFFFFFLLEKWSSTEYKTKTGVGFIISPLQLPCIIQCNVSL